MLITNCKNCNITITRNSGDVKKNKSGNFFCSQSCAATYNNFTSKIKRNPPKARICTKCKIEFFAKTLPNGNSTSKNNCSNCYNRFVDLKNRIKSMTYNEYKNTIGTKANPYWMHARLRDLCRSWNKHLIQKPCQKCGYSFYTELCHIKPIASFEKDVALLAEINHESNILVLCPNHHKEFDKNQLKLQDIPQRGESYEEK